MDCWEGTLDIKSDEDGKDYVLNFKHKSTGAFFRISLFDHSKELQNEWSKFMHKFNTDKIFQHTFSDSNGGIEIQGQWGHLEFTIARFGKGGLDDFIATFSLPAKDCRPVFQELLNDLLSL